MSKTLYFPTGLSVARAKKDAKKLAIVEGVKLAEALDRIARQNSYDNWDWAFAMSMLPSVQTAITGKVNSDTTVNLSSIAPLKLFDSKTGEPITDIPTKKVKKLRELVEHNYDLPLYKHDGKFGFNLMSFFFDKQHHQDKDGNTVYLYAPHEELIAAMKEAGCLNSLDRLKVDTSAYEHDVLLDLTRYMDSGDTGGCLMSMMPMGEHRLKVAGREGEELLRRVPVS